MRPCARCITGRVSRPGWAVFSAKTCVEVWLGACPKGSQSCDLERDLLRQDVRGALAGHHVAENGYT